MILNGPEHPLRIAGATVLLKDAAARYMPVTYLHERLDNMRPVQTLYEADAAEHHLLFNYYVHWEDEIAPNPLWHRIYRAIRTIQFGSPDDIEFVQVGVSRDTGRAVSLVFERDPSGRPDAPIPIHHLVSASRIENTDVFAVTVRGKPAPDAAITSEADRLPVFVSVWNHIHDFHHGKGIRIDDPPLRPLTDHLFKKYRMRRRSLPPGR